ncbi:hypothetical protein BDZ94DRAFT_1241425 [Collybia nuda]|uniref:Uncharacterized protein n=1 Tax=Collybia nuda TaxID=64659 RepID=A0A9P5XW30_9AGAR|nr:hypothetical protein BDZ94DRAFT_1241425 [Collybia nuda]
MKKAHSGRSSRLTFEEVLRSYFHKHPYVTIDGHDEPTLPAVVLIEAQNAITTAAGPAGIPIFRPQESNKLKLILALNPGFRVTPTILGDFVDFSQHDINQLQEEIHALKKENTRLLGQFEESRRPLGSKWDGDLGLDINRQPNPLKQYPVDDNIDSTRPSRHPKSVDVSGPPDHLRQQPADNDGGAAGGTNRDIETQLEDSRTCADKASQSEEAFPFPSQVQRSVGICVNQSKQLLSSDSGGGSCMFQVTRGVQIFVDRASQSESDVTLPFPSQHQRLDGVSIDRPNPYVQIQIERSNQAVGTHIEDTRIFIDRASQSKETLPGKNGDKQCRYLRTNSLIVAASTLFLLYLLIRGAVTFNRALHMPIGDFHYQDRRFWDSFNSAQPIGEGLITRHAQDDGGLWGFFDHWTMANVVASSNYDQLQKHWIWPT